VGRRRFASGGGGGGCVGWGGGHCRRGSQKRGDLRSF
jgi:hypothetical protein